MIFLQQAATQGPDITSLLLLGAIVIVFYFFMIRPQQKKQKELKDFRENLKTGDSIVTVGGLHGRIIEINKDTITVEADKAVKLTFDRTAISHSTK